MRIEAVCGPAFKFRFAEPMHDGLVLSWTWAQIAAASPSFVLRLYSSQARFQHCRLHGSRCKNSIIR